MQVEKLASAIYNDIVAGLSGITSTPAISINQLQDDIIDERLQIIKEYSMKNLIPRKDLMYAINCIELDCQSLDKCCNTSNFSKPELHFEIPQLVNDFGTDNALEYIGSPDRQNPFIVYTSINELIAHKYRKRGKNKPFVYIDTSLSGLRLLFDKFNITIFD